jgi:nitrogen regulatory protein P-II 1
MPGGQREAARFEDPRTFLYGRQKGHLEQYAGREYQIEFLPKVAVECVIDDAHREELVQLVLATCRTSRIGDGKIFLTRVEAETV